MHIRNRIQRRKRAPFGELKNEAISISPGGIWGSILLLQLQVKSFSRTLLRRRWGLWKHHQSRSRSVTREKTSLESFVKHICTARIFTQFHVFVKKKSFWKLTRMKKFCSTYWKGGSLANLLRIFSLVLERCTHCGRNSSTDCNGLLRFYSLVWGYKVSLSLLSWEISADTWVLWGVGY